MALRKNKKSQIFTLIAIVLLILFFVSYEVYSIIYERQAIKTRIKSMDSFLFSIEQDLERQFYISGFRIIFLAENEIARTGTYIPNFNSLFQEAILNGTINSEKSEILNGATISDIMSSIQDKAEKMNLNINFSDIKVSVGQEDPWNIIVYFNATLNLTDKSNLALWQKKEEIKARVSIENFEDPIYLIKTSGKVSRKIKQTLYEGNYVSGTDKTNLSLHLENKYYANNTDAPSFLKRMQGSLESDANGIESFVYLPDLTAQGLQVSDKSVVDYIYFSSDNPSSFTISGLPSWFKLDSQHCSRYQLTC